MREIKLSSVSKERTNKDKLLQSCVTFLSWDVGKSMMKCKPAEII